MIFPRWQVGLDIQNGKLSALGIQRCRRGWRLCHWWQHPLSQDMLRYGALQRSDELTTVLQCWRKQLPRHFSLRVGFSPQQVLQHRIDLPNPPLHEPMLNNYVRAVAKRFFPIELDMLMLDYRPLAESPNQLCITAARRDMLEPWLDCLSYVGLLPQVLELTMTALYVLSQALALEPQATLVHRLADYWLWFSPQNAQQPCGWCTYDDAADFCALRRRYLSASTTIYYSAVEADPIPDGTYELLPLKALQQIQPSLPPFSSTFALAAGLALRSDDQ